MAQLQLTADEVLATTRAVRKRMDSTRPVELSLIRECLDIAIQAPSGGNAPRFSFVVVTDAVKRKALADIYRRAIGTYLDLGPPAAHKAVQGHNKMLESVKFQVEHFHEIPVLMIPCIAPRAPRIQGLPLHALGASLYPAVWSYMLAARERGLGTCLTTAHLIYEQEAAEVLGIPFDDVAQGCMIPTAYTIGTSFRQGPRPALDSFLHFDQWDG